MTKIVYPYNSTEEDLIGTEEFIYDAAGRLVLKKDGNDDLTAYEYDGLGRLVGVDYEYTGSFVLADPWPDAQYFSADVSYSYEQYDAYTGTGVDVGSSLKTLMTDSTGTSRYYYDAQGRLSRYVPSIRNPGDDTWPYVMEYAYNNLGQKTSVKIGEIDPESECVEYSYDNSFDYATCDLSDVVYDSEYEYYSNGWLKSVSSGTSPVAEYTYDVTGARTRIDLGNETYTEFSYDTDPRYRLSTITHKLGTTTLATIDYTATARDKVGNPKSMTDWTGTWTYGYDDNNRLTSAVPPSPIPNQPAGGSYGYDWVGNRLNPPSGANHMVYNTADQLTTWPGMHGYTYYPDGSMHEVKNAGGTSTLELYTYTPDGLLDTATYDSRTLSNTWDADQNRVTLDANGQDYQFVYDIGAGIPAVIEEVKQGTPDVTVRYFREPEGSLIARVEGANTIYYHFDELGSTRLLTDAEGDVTDKYAYDAYGALISHDRTADSVDQPYQYVGQLGYYAHCQEPELGLLQLGVRLYDWEKGQFTQRDPVREDRLGSYVYARSRATRVVDPDGLQGFTYPTFKKGASCDGYSGIDTFIAEAQNYVVPIVDGLSLGRCPSTITVNCKNKGKCGEKVECGRSYPNSGSGASMMINYAPPCSSPKCLILHEMVHTCGMPGHKWYGSIRIPGCEGVGFGR